MPLQQDGGGASQPGFLARVTGFLGALRTAGLPADPAAAVSFCEALGYIDIGHPGDFHAAARALLVHRREHLATFDDVFRDYWLRQPRLPAPASRDRDTEIGGRAPVPAPRSAAREQPVHGEAQSASGYSPDEIIARRDLALLSEEEIARARELLRDFIRMFAALRSRRYVPDAHAAVPDFRRMLRRMVAGGGEPPPLAWRRRSRHRTRLLLLCDVSGSMERYSRFLLEFIYALRRELPDTEVAVFATRMTVITDLLRSGSVARSLRDVAGRAGDWGGGTDIGGCLRDFNDRYARELLRSRSTVVLLSDGWDRGDAALMSAEIARLRRRAHRLVWLNPLLGYSGYEPLTRGMRTALPWLDHFLPAHSVESLIGFARVLAAEMR